MTSQHLSSIRPTLFLNNICGYASIKCDSNRQKLQTNNLDFLKATTVVVILILLTAYFGYFRADDLNSSYSDSDSTCFTNLTWTFKINFEMFVGLFTIIMIYYDFLSKKKIVLAIHHGLIGFDGTLERELSMAIDYGRIRRNVTLYLLAFVFLSLVQLCTVFCLFYLGFDIWIEFWEHLFSFVISVLVSVKVFHLCSLLVALRSRYKTLAKLLKSRCQTYSSTSEQPFDDQQMRVLIRAHDELCDVVDSINSIFSKFIFVFFMYHFIIVSLILFFGCKILLIAPKLDGLKLFQSYFYTVVAMFWLNVIQMFLQMSAIVYAAHAVAVEAEDVTISAQKAAGLFDQEPFRNKLQVLLMALIHRKPKITALHCYEIEPGLIVAMIGVIFTYVIILMQFELTDGLGCKRFLQDIIGVDEKTLAFLSTLNESQHTIFFQVLDEIRGQSDDDYNITLLYSLMQGK